MRKIVAFFKGGTPVVLEDWRGEIYKSIAYTTPFGDRRAAVYWFTGVGSAILLDGGEVSRESKSVYITRWAEG